MIRFRMGGGSRIGALVVRGVALYFVVACLVVLVLLSVGQLSNLLQQVSNGNLPLSVVLQLLFLAMPTLLVTVIPLALFFATYLVFANLYRHNEMVAIRSAGVGLPRLFGHLLGLILVVTILEAFLSLSWSPLAQRHLEDESARLAGAAAAALIQPGAFADLPDHRVVYVGAAVPGKNRYRDIFVDLGGQSVPDLATASYGEIDIDSAGGVTFVMIHGHRYLGNPGSAGFKVWSFAHYRVALAAPHLNGDGASGEHWGVASWGQLWSARLGAHARAVWTEMEWRLFWPLLVPVLVLLAIPLAYAEPRRSQRAAGLLLGVMLLLGANNLLVYLKEGIHQGRLPLFPGLFWAWLVLAVLAAYAFSRRRRDLPVVPSWVPGLNL